MQWCFNYNVSIEIGEAPLIDIYKVHSIILQSRSPYFKKKFDEITFNENHVKVLKLPNISIKSFIKYIYGGKFSLEKLKNSDTFDLLIASNEFELDELIEHLQSHLVNDNSSWLRLISNLLLCKHRSFLCKWCFNYNVSIEIGEAPLIDIYKVHSIILQSRSPYFKKKFDEITFNENHVKVLKLPNISIKSFIKYIYGGKFSLEKLKNSDTFDLLIASNEFELDELIEHLQSHLVNDNSSWLRLKFAQIYRTSYQSKIWEYVIEWGKAKNPMLPTNLDKWTSDNFLSLKKTLRMPPTHVVEKIYPYQQILEQQLFLDINIKLITPNKPISSIVLPPQNIFNTIFQTRITPILLSSNINIAISSLLNLFLFNLIKLLHLKTQLLHEPSYKTIQNWKALKIVKIKEVNVYYIKNK
ncbi:hypothetical protein Glove_246g18 [Diversispora epigaea]|uniref:BTB domain-containing protein n=1 Tax=Diversispora epigaea TaxID=1348612 RepID=A0A397IFC2_9GLOM|nr:hypothetical protein Glove_246g18 [Diversispora epigaea]